MRYAVNLSLLFAELPLLERPAAAAAAGFDAVEFWWPFSTATPGPAEVDAFVTAIERAGVRLVALNLYAGDMPAGDRGLASWPGRADEFRAGVEAATAIGARLGCRAFNALYGNRRPDADPVGQDILAVANLVAAARTVAEIGGTILIEAISGAPAYPLRTAADAAAVIERVHAATDVTNLALLADLYHLSVNGDDVSAALSVHSGLIGHVQFADCPGRHEPGTGNLDLAGWFRQLDHQGYAGYLAAEYVPSGATADSFGWRKGLTR